MASFSFIYRSKNSTGNLTVRLIHKHLDYQLRTPYLSYREYWWTKTTKAGKSTWKHKKLEELKGGAEIKSHRQTLQKFISTLEDRFIEDSNNSIPITKEWFKQAIRECHSIAEGKEQIESVTENMNAEKLRLQAIEKNNLISEIIKGIYAKYAANPDELKKFKTTYNWLESYEKYIASIKGNSNFKYKAIDFNQKFVDGFKSWGLQEMLYKNSTIINHLKRIKRAIEYSHMNDSKNEIRVNKQLQNLKFTSNKERELIKDKIVITLSFDELDKIDKLDLSNNPELMEVQKCILIGCETGLRFSDFNQLNDGNLKKHINGIEYWEFKVRKTKQWVQIVKTDRIKDLIDKYGEPSTSYSDNDDIPLNRKIKKVCEKAKINEMVEGELNKKTIINDKKTRRYIKGVYPKHKLIQTRTFRRSFATNYYGKIPVELIMQVTGHTTEKMLREYINVHDDNKIINAFNVFRTFHQTRKEGVLKKVD